MLEFPLWYLLLPYGFVVLATSIFFFFNVYHVAKFGLKSLTTELVLAAYFVSYLAVLVFSVIMLLEVDWVQVVTLNDILPFSGGSAKNFGL